MVDLLTVTVFFTNGTSAAVGWSNTATCTAAGFCGQASGAAGNGTWTLTESFNTGSVGDLTNPDTTGIFAWSLTNTSTTLGIASVQLNGVVSNTRGVVFDRDFFGAPPGASSGGQEGSAGGAGGLDFTFASEAGGNSPYTVTVQYSNIAAIIAAPPCRGSNWVGNNPVTGCGDAYGTVSFTFGSPFIASTTSTPTRYAFFQDTDLVDAPEPVTFWLIGGGLAAIVAYRRRRASV